MSEVIYRATPGESLVNIQKLDQSIRFVGNDTESIIVENVNYGENITLDEFDSLSVIEIKQPGAVVNLSRFPENTLKIIGNITSVNIRDGDSSHTISKHSSIGSETNLLTPLPFNGRWDVVVTRNSDIKKEDCDALMIKTEGISNLEIDEDWSHISVIGNPSLHNVTINGNDELAKFSLSNASNLKSLYIRKQVLECSLQDCKSIESIHGIGGKLTIGGDSYKIFGKSSSHNLTISGFWLEIPKWYKMKVGALNIAHFNDCYSNDELIHCNDLNGTRMDYFLNFNGTDLSSFFSDEFGIGHTIPETIKLLLNNPSQIKNLDYWCHSDLSLFDQYIAMRILTSLLIQGFEPSKIVKIRDTVFHTNRGMRISEQSISNLQQRSNRYRKITYDSGHQQIWNLPLDSHADFSRLDFEMWLYTEDDENSPTSLLSYLKNFNTTRINPLKIPLFQSEFSRIMVFTIMSASIVEDRIESAQEKLNELLKLMYTTEILPSSLGFAQFMVKHMPKFLENNSDVTDVFIDQILLSESNPAKIAVILAALVNKNNSTKARIELKRLAGEDDVNLELSRALNAISILGKHAFITGKAKTPTWPYLMSWNELIKK